MSDFFDKVKRLKRMAATLINQTYPKTSIEEELDIVPLKSSQLTIDGYDVTVVFSISDHFTHYIEFLQIYSTNEMPFIPFYVVCKLAKAFLGTENLIFTSVFKDDKKIYCWSLKKSKADGTSIRVNRGKDQSYEGLDFLLLDLKSFNLYSQE